MHQWMPMYQPTLFSRFFQMASYAQETIDSQHCSWNLFSNLLPLKRQQNCSRMLKKPCYFPKSGLQLFYLQIIHVEAAAAPDRLRMSLSDHDWCAVLWGGCTSKMAGLGPYRDTIWQTIKGKPKEMIRSMFMDVPGVFCSYILLL